MTGFVHPEAVVMGRDPDEQSCPNPRPGPLQHPDNQFYPTGEEGMPAASCLQQWMAVRSPVLQFSLLVKCSPSVRCSLGRSQVVVQCIHGLARLGDARLTAVDFRHQKGI